MSLQLPDRPNLDLLRRHAKAALRVGRLLYPAWQLANAQRAVAQGYGLASWDELKRSIASRRRETRSVGDRKTPSGRAFPDTALPAAANRFVGSWMALGADTERVALGIAETASGLLFIQVAGKRDGQAIASSLLLRADGEEHHIPFGNDLRLRATWPDSQTLQTTVTQNGVTVAEGTYGVSDDGQTLSVITSAARLTFERVADGVLPEEGARPLRHRVSRLRALAVRTFIASALLFNSGCAGSATRLGAAGLSQDASVAAIEALNRHDVTAALAADLHAIASQWTEDFVILPPTGPIVRGRAAALAIMKNAQSQLEKFEPVGYEVDFEEIVVSGDYAFAWGQFRTTARVRASGADLVSNGRILRVYQRQPSGRWLMHRTMSTLDSGR